jgi:hypothetical protein
VSSVLPSVEVSALVQGLFISLVGTFRESVFNSVGVGVMQRARVHESHRRDGRI